MSKFNWQEPTAYGCAAVATAIGFYLGLKCEPAWLSRAGSVVVVCGVLLATSRKLELLQAKGSAYLANHSATEFDTILAEHQNPDGSPISPAQGAALRTKIYGEARKEISELIEERRRVFKLHEIVIVVVGTLMNGFGEWVVKLLIRHAT